MKKLFSILIFFSIILFTSCDNEPVDLELQQLVDETNAAQNPTNGNPSTGGGGNSSGGGTTTGDYWPMAAGNTWTYNNSIDGVAQENYSMEIAGLEDFEGNPSYLYDQFFASAQATDGTLFDDVSVSTYSRKDNGDYHLGVSGFTAELDGLFEISQTGFSYIILKDYLPVGSTWSQDYTTTTTTTVLIDGTPPIPPTILNNETDMEILEKDVSVEVNGTTYSPVIIVKFTQIAGAPGFPANTINYNYYFARDVGIVKIEGTVNDSGDAIVSEVLYELSSYQLF